VSRHPKVKDLMTHPVHSCGIHDAAVTPASLMWEHDCGVVPVVDDDGRLVGVVTDRDICMAAYLQGRPLADIPIASFMAPHVATCRPDDEVVWAEHVMSLRQVHRLPVVDHGGRPVGMISLGDLARVAPRAPTRRHWGDFGDELLETMAAISQPRMH
jgi:CBS domain-containing protein